MNGLASPSEFLIKMKRKEITINDLALMVGRGFAAVDKRFDAVDKHLDAMDGKLKDVDMRLARIERDILEDYGNRIEVLEPKIRML